MPKNRILLFTWISVLVMFSTVVHPGYEIFYSDQLIDYPAIVQKLNPELYPNDLLLEFNQTQFTYFDEILVSVIQHSNMDLVTTTFVFFLLLKFIFFLTIFYISQYFLNNYWFGFFLLPVYVAGSWIYGTTAVTVGNYLSPRMMGITLGLVYLVFYFHGWQLLGAFFLGITVLVHPISAVPYLSFFCLNVIYDLLRNPFKYYRRHLITILMPMVAVYFLMIGGETGLEFFSLMDPRLGTLTFVYLSNWGIVSLTQLTIEIFLCFICLWELKNYFSSEERNRYFQLLLVTPVVVTVFNFFFADLINWQIFVQIQSYRSLALLKFFLPMFFGIYLYKDQEILFSDRWRIVSHFGVLLSFLISYSYRSFPIFIFGPLVIIQWVSRKLPEDIFPWYPTNTLLIESGRGILLLGTFFPVSLYVYLKRGFQWVLIPILIIVLSLAIEFILRKKDRPTFKNLSLMTLIAGVCFVVYEVPAWSYQPSFYENESFVSTCEWMKQETSTQDVFLAYPFTTYGGKLRLACRRNVFYSRKGTAQMLFNVKFAKRWRKRRKWVRELKKNPAKIKKLVDEYRIDYVVTEKKSAVSFPVVFESNKFRIYKIK